MNRRRAITILGAGTLCGLSACRRPGPLQTYTNIAFGTDVHFQTHGVSEADFKALSTACTARLREIEALFSLQDPQSAICRLNRDGRLPDAPEEFIGLVKTALSIGSVTKGIFDITIQPLWNWRLRWKDADLTERGMLEGAPWQEALALVDYRKVSISGREISFGKPGMAISLNGIVQGHATDQIKDLLRKSGIANALINIGEYAAIGNAPDGTPWSVELAPTGKPRELPAGRALAASSGGGLTFDPEGRFNHIFRPADGSNPDPAKTVIVTAPTATLADALATAFTVANEMERKEILAGFPEADFLEIHP